MKPTVPYTATRSATTESAVAQLRTAIERAATAPGDVVIERPGPDGEPHYVTALSRRPVAGTRITIEGAHLPNLVGEDGRVVRIPPARMAGERLRFDAAVMTASRVCGYGTHLIIARERDVFRADGAPAGVPLLAREAAQLRVVRSATFVTQVGDDDDVPTAELDAVLAVGEIEWPDIPVHGFRVRVPRSARRAVGGGAIEDEVMFAIASGLGDLADRLVLDAILDANPPAFTLGAAAAVGLRADQLRAIVGRSGAGAAWADDGSLRAAGVPAELSSAVVPTVVGDFSAAAVAVRAEIDLLIERRGLSGGVDVTCWVAATPVIARPDVFWKLEG